MATVTRETARRWAPACEEYFEHFQRGWYDHPNHLQFILPVDEITIDSDLGDLIIGHAGVDGIYFCLREDKAGVYAYYGIEDQHVLVAPSVDALVKGWVDGSISV